MNNTREYNISNAQTNINSIDSSIEKIAKGGSLDKIIRDFSYNSIDFNEEVKEDLSKRIINAITSKEQYYTSFRGRLPHIYNVIMKALFNRPTPIDRANQFLQSLPIILNSKEFTCIESKDFDFEKIQNFKQLKKDAKKLLKQTPNEFIRTELETIIGKYDALVESIEVLKDLRELSRCVRGKKTSNEQQIMMHKFMHFLYVDPEYMPTSSERKGGLGKLGDVIGSELLALAKEQTGHIQKRIELFEPKKWNKNWPTIRKKMWKGAQEASPLLQEKRISWITGNTSSALIGIKRVADERFICKEEGLVKLKTKPALVPTGTLKSDTFLVPLGGELEGGIIKNVGTNFNSLSGVALAHLQVASFYAYSEGFKFDKEREKKIVENFNPTARPEINTKEYYTVNPERLRIAVIRLLLTGSIEKNQLKNHLEEILVKTPADDKSTFNNQNYYGKSNYAEKSDIQTILDLIDSVPNLELDQEEEDFLNNAFPIIWASSTIRTFEMDGSALNERSYRGIAALGEDIQIAFTSADKVQTLQKYLDEKLNVQVKVFSLDSAHYLRTRQSTFNLEGAKS